MRTLTIFLLTILVALGVLILASLLGLTPFMMGSGDPFFILVGLATLILIFILAVFLMEDS